MNRYPCLDRSSHYLPGNNPAITQMTRTPRFSRGDTGNSAIGNAGTRLGGTVPLQAVHENTQQAGSARDN